MIRTLLRVAFLRLRRDRAALALTFALPLVFFSIFAVIFGGMGGDGGLPAVEVVLVDEDDTAASRRLLRALSAEPGFTGPGADHPHPLVLGDRASARKMVREGESDVAVVLPSGLGASVGSFDPAAPKIVLFADTVANPVAHQIVQGLLQKVVTAGMPDLMVERGIGLFEEYAGALSEEQRAAVDSFLPRLQDATDGGGEAGAEESAVGESEGPSPNAMTPVGVTVEDVGRLDESRARRQRMVAFQAAAIGVMFLLFSVVASADALLREEETGTLDRLLNAGASMDRLLAGYWAWAAILGGVQVTLMFVWGWAVFGLDLWTPEHLAGFAVMTAVTASAASAFGLVLGTACRSRAQLNGLSTILILAMSALGGSMVPRFLLRANPLFDKLGLVTFNAWAIDGYQKVFWYETGLLSIWPQVSVLVLVSVVCLAIARQLARRWEAV